MVPHIASRTRIVISSLRSGRGTQARYYARQYGLEEQRFGHQLKRDDGGFSVEFQLASTKITGMISLEESKRCSYIGKSCSKCAQGRNVPAMYQVEREPAAPLSHLQDLAYTALKRLKGIFIHDRTP